jgi:glutamine amidotransferase
MERLVIIDYGSGNLHSAAKAFERAACEASQWRKYPYRWQSEPYRWQPGWLNKLLLWVATLRLGHYVTNDPAMVATADRIVLPGVGAFADCRKGLDNISGMVEALNSAVVQRRVPFLGICVGCQLMAERGLEFGVTPGFGWIKGDVKAIEPRDPALKVPHMGWNTLQVANPHPLLDGIATGPDGWHAYFVHSYHLATPDRAALVAETDYGGPVTAMVGKDNLAGTQFHPEKSQTLGLRLIANFLKWHP